MHRPEAIREVLSLRAEGLGARRIAARTGLPVSTVRDWLAGKLPRSAGWVAPSCDRCGAPHEVESLPDSYLYLLGLYLGDGTISRHRRDVYRLRIFLDLRYPGIIGECERAIASVARANEVNRLERYSNYVSRETPSNVEVSCFSKSWPCLFPQHGAGKKHTRRIWLAGWQQRLAESAPEPLLRGLIHSDGCRALNTRGRRDTWSAPRYSFKNLSTDITSIFCTACERAGLHWTGAFPADETKGVTIYVSRKADVARMDEFIGPKG
jgi:hypothetical protein